MPPRTPRHRPSTPNRRTWTVAPPPPRSPRARPTAGRTSRPAAVVPLPAVSLGRYPFAEPTTRWEELQHSAGLFVILERPTDPGQSYRPLFVDEAEDVHHALAKLSARALLPAAVGTRTVVYAALYTELVKAARRQIVAELRAVYQLPATLPPTVPPSTPSLPRRMRGRGRKR